MGYYLAFYKIDRHTDACYNMDKHWKYDVELMQSAIDSSEDNEIASKERFNLARLDDSFPDKPQGHMMQTVIAAAAMLFSGVWFCVTLWTAPYQAPLSMGFSRQEYWSGLPFPSLKL